MSFSMILISDSQNPNPFESVLKKKKKKTNLKIVEKYTEF